MDLVLAGLTWEVCLLYLDDVVVMADTFERHLERLKLVESSIKVEFREVQVIPAQNEILMTHRKWKRNPARS